MLHAHQFGFGQACEPYIAPQLALVCFTTMIVATISFVAVFYLWQTRVAPSTRPLGMSRADRSYMTSPMSLTGPIKEPAWQGVLKTVLRSSAS